MYHRTCTCVTKNVSVCLVHRRSQYRHQSRHDHAVKRVRGPGGRFGGAQQTTCEVALHTVHLEQHASSALGDYANPMSGLPTPGPMNHTLQASDPLFRGPGGRFAGAQQTTRQTVHLEQHPSSAFVHFEQHASSALRDANPMSGLMTSGPMEKSFTFQANDTLFPTAQARLSVVSPPAPVSAAVLSAPPHLPFLSWASHLPPAYLPVDQAPFGAHSSPGDLADTLTASHLMSAPVDSHDHIWFGDA